jgi:uncharacterized protein HemY
MTGPEHFKQAEEYLEKARSSHASDYDGYVTRAHVHATLALAAATALAQTPHPRAADVNRWDEVAGAWPDSTK